MSDRLTHNRRRDCVRYGEAILIDHLDNRDGEAFHRCPVCGAAMSDLVTPQ